MLLPVVLETLPLPALPTPLAEPLDAPDPPAAADPVDELVPLDDAAEPAAEPRMSPPDPFPLRAVEPLPEPPVGDPMVPLAPLPPPELPPGPRPEVTEPLSAASVPIEELPQPIEKYTASKHATLDDDLFEFIFLWSTDASRSTLPKRCGENEVARVRYDGSVPQKKFGRHTIVDLTKPASAKLATLEGAALALHF